MTADDAVVDHMDKDCCGDGAAAAASVNGVNIGGTDDGNDDDDRPLVAFHHGGENRNNLFYTCECPCCGVHVNCDR